MVFEFEVCRPCSEVIAVLIATAEAVGDEDAPAAEILDDLCPDCAASALAALGGTGQGFPGP